MFGKIEIMWCVFKKVENCTCHIIILFGCTSPGCVRESGDFATLFFLVWQHWGGCRYRHSAENFKAF
jgi:hypothetical protein